MPKTLSGDRAAVRRSAFQLTGVEGWRALAAVSVVLAHVWTSMDLYGTGLGPGMDHPFVGYTMSNLDIVIDLFFVLSGMLIWLPFAAAAFGGAEVPRGGVFLLRRTARFLPLYFVVILVMWSRHNYDAAEADWIDLAEHMTLTQSLDSERIFYTVGPAWTLSVEWFFYLSMALVAPGFVRVIRRGRRPTGRVLIFLAGTVPIFAASVAWKWAVSDEPVTDWALRFGPIAKADIFIIGMWFGTIALALGRRKLHPIVLFALVAGAVALYAPVVVPPGIEHNLHYQVVRHTLAAAGFAMIMLGLTSSRWQWPARIVDNRLLLPLSVLAYSIYLLHGPAIEFIEEWGWFTYQQSVQGYLFNTVVVFLLVLPVAWAAHKLIEMPWAGLAFLVDREGRRREWYPHVTDSDWLQDQHPDRALDPVGGPR